MAGTNATQTSQSNRLGSSIISAVRHVTFAWSTNYKLLTGLQIEFAAFLDRNSYRKYSQNGKNSWPLTVVSLIRARKFYEYIKMPLEPVLNINFPLFIPRKGVNKKWPKFSSSLIFRLLGLRISSVQEMVEVQWPIDLLKTIKQT